MTPDEADARWHDARRRLSDQRALVAADLPGYPEELPDPLSLPVTFRLLRLLDLEWELLQAARRRIEARGNVAE